MRWKTGFHDDWAKIHVIQLTGTIFKLNSHIKETNVLTKFHENCWAKIVTSRVFTCFHYIHIEKNAPPTGDHVFSMIWTIFELVRDINKTNVLTNIHDDWAKIVTSRVSTSHVIQLTGTIFELNSHIKVTNVLTKFHENYINKTNVLTNFMMIGHTFHVIQLTGTIFELNSHIKETNVLTKFHENWAKHVTSRVFTKNAPPTGDHVFSPIWTIFELVRDINKTNVLTNFHDDWAKIVNSRVFTSHVIQLTGTIFDLNSHIKKTNVLTKFHENWAKNATSRKNDPPIGDHVFSPIWTIFELVRDINKTNVLTNFHDDWATIVTSRVFKRKTAPPPGCHVIHMTGTIFELNSHIKETNVLTKFHEHWTKNVTSRVFTCFQHIHIEKNAPPTGDHIFSPFWTIFELNSHIKETNVLTKFHQNWTKNVTSRVFTCFHYIHIEKNAPPTGGHVLSPIWTIFKLVRDTNKTNVLTNFHDDWAKIVTSRVFTRKTAHPPGSHVIQLTGTIFELNSHIKKINVLTKFHENWAKNVTSRVFTCFHYSQIRKTAPPTGGHVFQRT
ncbi:hypothetical protein DPMN_097595 [Dreissena polymorpha]|uniref:Uncharacterized protein n=1 Tax=Dreissena polymorpha TaxID=45954 RepID=A0A9D4LAJ8_DREPO|nr:hypothetical protein DPMN_097595 [Dreissena polymorpha]